MSALVYSSSLIAAFLGGVLALFAPCCVVSSLPFPMLQLRVSGSTPGGIFALGLTAGVASSCCAPVLAGVVALSALASSVTGALGLGLAYVFGIVFPLLVAVLVWDRVQPGSRGFALRTRRIRLRGLSLPWTDAVAAVMFLTIGVLALLIAYTGQSTYLPGWLEVWNRWVSGLAGNVSVWLGSLPTAIQAIALGLLALVVITALYRSWKLGPASDRRRTGGTEPAQPEVEVEVSR